MYVIESVRAVDTTLPPNSLTPDHFRSTLMHYRQKFWRREVAQFRRPGCPASRPRLPVLAQQVIGASKSLLRSCGSVSEQSRQVCNATLVLGLDEFVPCRDKPCCGGCSLAFCQVDFGPEECEACDDVSFQRHELPVIEYKGRIEQ
jgi:hypothetical protein